MAAKGRGGGKTPERLVEFLRLAVDASSQSAVARESGVGVAAINRYLNGIGEPSAATLKKFADFFKVPVEWLRQKENEEANHDSTQINFYQQFLTSVQVITEVFFSRFEDSVKDPLLVYHCAKLIYKMENIFPMLLSIKGKFGVEFSPVHLQEVKLRVDKLKKMLDDHFSQIH